MGRNDEYRVVALLDHDVMRGGDDRHQPSLVMHQHHAVGLLDAFGGHRLDARDVGERQHLVDAGAGAEIDEAGLVGEGHPRVLHIGCGGFARLLQAERRAHAIGIQDEHDRAVAEDGVA